MAPPKKTTKPPVVTTKTGAVAKPKTIDDYIGTDPEYMRALTNIKSTMDDFLAEAGLKRNRIGTQYALDKTALDRANIKNVDDTENSYAARGLIQSSVYNKATGDVAQDYNTKTAAALAAKTAQEQDIAMQQRQLESANKAARGDARSLAIARRAAKLGLEL
jgi:hypothetical protein